MAYFAKSQTHRHKPIKLKLKAALLIAAKLKKGALFHRETAEDDNY